MGLFLGKKWSVWAFEHLFLILLVQFEKFILDSCLKYNFEQNGVFRIFMVINYLNLPKLIGLKPKFLFMKNTFKSILVLIDLNLVRTLKNLIKIFKKRLL